MDLAVHEAVLASGAARSGATIHYIDETVDGGEIVMQEAVAVGAGETAASLKAKVQPLEGKLFVHAVRMAAAARASLCGPHARARRAHARASTALPHLALSQLEARTPRLCSRGDDRRSAFPSLHLSLSLFSRRSNGCSATSSSFPRPSAHPRRPSARRSRTRAPTPAPTATATAAARSPTPRRASTSTRVMSSCSASNPRASGRTGRAATAPSAGLAACLCARARAHARAAAPRHRVAHVTACTSLARGGQWPR